MRNAKIIPNLYFVVFLFLICSPFFVFAHPGGVDANGCHVCRTKCEQYGVLYNVLHCHNKSASSTPAISSSSPATISAPAPTTVSKPAVKTLSPTEPQSLTPKEIETLPENQTTQTIRPFFTKSSMLWLALSGGIGLLAGLIFSATKRL